MIIAIDREVQVLADFLFDLGVEILIVWNPEYRWRD